MANNIKEPIKTSGLCPKWLFHNLRQPCCGNVVWSLASTVTISAVGLFSKFVLCTLNKTTCYNKSYFEKLLADKKYIPLVTVSNHRSCFDDPGIWGCLNVGVLCNGAKMRWALAAHEVCFTKKTHSFFFMLGKCVPVIRGQGVYQEAINFCVERLKKGDWLHVFPEGQINASEKMMRLKWGVGRVIYDCPVIPIVIPIWHVGMDDVLPNEYPYILKMGKRVTINFGNPIDLSFISELKAKDTHGEIARKIITDIIQEELLKLKEATEELHKISTNNQ